MNRMLIRFTLLAVAATACPADVLCERWGGKGKGLAYPGTMTVAVDGKSRRIRFDLSALPTGAKVYHASLHCAAAGDVQPLEPVQIRPIEGTDGDGKPRPAAEPLKLEAPFYRSFDVTAAVARWVAEPKTNLGLAVVRFDNWDAGRTFLEVQYEGAGRDLPAQVTGLRAVHHDGQTFLIFRELAGFRPAAEKVFWVEDTTKGRKQRFKSPGVGESGRPRIPAITLKTLRDLAGLSVAGRKAPRQMQPIRVVRKVPHVRYRVYRSRRPITAKTIAAARFVGEAAPLCAVIERMRIIISHGEYYWPEEDPDSVLPTWCYADGKPVAPGEAFFVHTPRAGGRFYYAVTTMQDGREDLAAFTAANSLAAPVAEVPADPQPVLQYVKPSRKGDRGGMAYYHAYWPAPPVANVPRQDPVRVIVGRMPKDEGPLGLLVKPSAGNRFFLERVEARRGRVLLLIEEDLRYSPMLGYSQGRGTLRSFAESRVDYYSVRYLLANIRWARGRHRIDPARIACDGAMHFAIRHPQLFRKVVLGPFGLDMDRKWNPGVRTLAARLGPAETTRTVDGHRAWDVVSLPWYLAQDPGRDIPALLCYFTQPKDGNHGAEYGWQDDPKGLSALQRFRQPHVAKWGRARICAEVTEGLAKMRWDRSVPAFSRCTLDNNPGNGDPDDGEPWGQINGYLLWEYDTIVDEPGRWEMTVYLVADCPEARCTVDVTPRHRSRFHPTPGARFRWTNTDLSTGRPLQSGTATADRWGLVTLKALIVTKGRNRIRIDAR
jgi:hypothetical protein